MSYKCPNTDNGCTVVLDSIGKNDRNLLQHLDKCDYTMVKCQKCKAEMLRSELAVHKKNTCPLRRIQCSRCCETMTATLYSVHIDNELHCNNLIYCPNKCTNIDNAVTHLFKHFVAAHIDICPLQNITCPFCQSDIVRRDFINHQQDLCPQRQVQCNKCNESMTATLHTAHTNNDLQCDNMTYCPNQCTDDDNIATRLLKQNTAVHIKYCLFQNITCPLCQSDILRRDFAQHQQDTCPMRPVQCNKCQATMTATMHSEHTNNEFQCSNLTYCPNQCTDSVNVMTQLLKQDVAAHTDVCPLQRVNCRLCQSGIVRRNFTKHQQDTCPLRQVECKKCNDTMTATLHNVHIDNELQCINMVYCPNQCTDNDRHPVQLLKRDVTTHVDICENQNITCPICNKQCKRRELIEHVDCSKPEHMLQLAKQLNTLKSDFATLAASTEKSMAESKTQYSDTVARFENDIKLLQTQVNILQTDLTAHKSAAALHFHMLSPFLFGATHQTHFYGTYPRCVPVTINSNRIDSSDLHTVGGVHCDVAAKYNNDGVDITLQTKPISYNHYMAALFVGTHALVTCKRSLIKAVPSHLYKPMYFNIQISNAVIDDILTHVNSTTITVYFLDAVNGCKLHENYEVVD